MIRGRQVENDGKVESRRILWSLDQIFLRRSRHHATWPLGFEPADSIFDEAVVLYDIDERCVTLARLPDSAARLLSTSTAPFSWVVVERRMTSLYRVRLTHFEALVDARLGERARVPTCVAVAPARSGGTLLVQLARRLLPDGGVFALNEISPLLAIKQRLPRERYLRALSALLRYQYRAPSSARAVFVKDLTITFAEDVREAAAGNVKLLLSSRRDHWAAVESKMRVLERILEGKWFAGVMSLQVLAWRFHSARRRFLRMVAPESRVVQHVHLLGNTTREIQVATCALEIERARALEPLCDLRIFYEDLVESAEETMAKISRLLEIDGDTKAAAEGLSVDSQEGTFIAKHLVTASTKLPTAEEASRIVLFCDTIGYPEIYEKMKTASS